MTDRKTSGIKGTSRAETLTKGHKSWLSACEIPYSVWDVTLAETQPELLELTKQLYGEKRPSEEQGSGIILHPGKMKRNHFWYIYMTYARDVAMRTENNFDNFTVYISPDVLAEEAQQGKLHRYWSSLYKFADICPKAIFLDGFYDAERSRTFYGSSEHRQSMVSFLMSMVSQGVQCFPFCYPSIDSATNWYPKFIVDLVKERMIQYQL